MTDLENFKNTFDQAGIEYIHEDFDDEIHLLSGAGDHIALLFKFTKNGILISIKAGVDTTHNFIKQELL